MEMRDMEYASYFVQNTIDEHWIKALIDRVGPWMAERNKSDWDIVRFTSIRMGILINNISRLKFAEIIYAHCRRHLKENDTPQSLANNMGQCKLTHQQSDIDHLLDSNQLFILEKEIRSMIEESGQEVDSGKPNIEQRLKEYLTTLHGKKENVKLRVNPCYSEDVRPQLSVEFYTTNFFYDKNEPSFIIAYECIDEQVTVSKVHELNSKYSDMKAYKLAIASPCRFNKEVVDKATKLQIQLIRIDPNKEIDDNCFVVPRNGNEQERQQELMDMLQGIRFMNTPVVVYDDMMATTSLSDYIQKCESKFAGNDIVKVPYINHKTIERLADGYSSVDIDELSLRINGGNLSVDICGIADSLGLEYCFCEMPEGNLGYLNLRTYKIYINNHLRNNVARWRFTMSHEIGHFVLHRDLLYNCGYTSIQTDGESPLYQTTTIKYEDINHMETQANKFASSLLMPRNSVSYLFENLKDDSTGKLYGDGKHNLYWDINNPKAIQTCNSMVKSMASHFQVSIEAMKYRLINLGLIVEGAEPVCQQLYFDF